MKYFYLILLVFASPLFASALSGEVIMTDFIFKQHRKTDTGSAVYYQIRAKKKIRKITKDIRFFLTEKRAEEKLYYQEGTLELAEVALHFKKAFLYNGNLILKDVNGKINGQACQAKRITFLINQKQISAARIIFISPNAITIKQQYQYAVSPYLYKEQS